MSDDNGYSAQSVVVHRTQADYKNSMLKSSAGYPRGAIFFREPPTPPSEKQTIILYNRPRYFKFTDRSNIDTLDSPLPLLDVCNTTVIQGQETNDSGPTISAVSASNLFTSSPSNQLSSSMWFSWFYYLSSIDLCGGKWGRSWPDGTCRLTVFGTPRTLGRSDFLSVIKDIPIPFGSTEPFELTDFVVLFGDERVALNPLNCPSPQLTINYATGGTQYQQTLATAEFATEDAARRFWCLCSAGILKLYGHVIGCIPDPSGYRCFGEAVAANFRNIDLDPLQNCACCYEINHNHSQLAESDTTHNTTDSLLFLPFVTESFTYNILKRLPRFIHTGTHVSWVPELDGASVTFPSILERDLFCVSQRYCFRVSYRTKETIKASFFRLGNKLTPCIIQPSNLPLQFSRSTIPLTTTLPDFIYHQHTTSNTSVNELSMTTPHKLEIDLSQEISSPIAVVPSSRRSSVVASKKRAKIGKNTLLTVNENASHTSLIVHSENIPHVDSHLNNHKNSNSLKQDKNNQILLYQVSSINQTDTILCHSNLGNKKKEDMIPKTLDCFIQSDSIKTDLNDHHGLIDDNKQSLLTTVATDCTRMKQSRGRGRMNQKETTIKGSAFHAVSRSPQNERSVSDHNEIITSLIPVKRPRGRPKGSTKKKNDSV